MEIKLGLQVMDRVTKLAGIAVARTVFLNGCIRVTVQPGLDKDGKHQGEQWYDEQQLDVIGAGLHSSTTVGTVTTTVAGMFNNQTGTGGPQTSHPPQGMR